MGASIPSLDEHLRNILHTRAQRRLSSYMCDGILSLSPLVSDSFTVCIGDKVNDVSGNFSTRRGSIRLHPQRASEVASTAPRRRIDVKMRQRYASCLHRAEDRESCLFEINEFVELIPQLYHHTLRLMGQCFTGA